jgi:hypothetical protein
MNPRLFVHHLLISKYSNFVLYCTWRDGIFRISHIALALSETLKSRKGSFEWNLVYNLHTYLHYLCSTQVGVFHYQIRNTGVEGARRRNTKLKLKVIISKFHAKMPPD